MSPTVDELIRLSSTSERTVAAFALVTDRDVAMLAGHKQRRRQAKQPDLSRNSPGTEPQGAQTIRMPEEFAGADERRNVRTTSERPACAMLRAETTNVRTCITLN
jgi:hypothetical protein